MARVEQQPHPPSTDPPGASYHLILDHVFSKPQLYDIPLRSMYAIQSASLEYTQAQDSLLPDILRRKQEARAIANSDFALVNELTLLPFHKHNCHALLNTLYPPVSTSQPTAALTPQVMRTQRQSFFEYISAVELHGTLALQPLILQGRRRKTDQTGWPAVHATLDAYLVIANALIHECAQVTGLDHFAIRPADTKHDRKKDSGVSFASSHRPSFGDYASSASSTSLTSSAKGSADSSRSATSTNSSKLERLAAELRRIRTRHKRDAGAAALAADRERMRLETLDALRGGPPYASPQMVTKSPPSTWPQSAAAEQAQQAQPAQSRQSLIHEPPPKSDPDMPRARTMRRLRSLGDIRTAARSLSRGRASDVMPGADVGSMTVSNSAQTSNPFDKDEMMRLRLIWEAKARRQAESAEQS